MEQQIKGYVLSSKILKEVLEGLIKESNFGHAVYIVEICKSFAGASQWKGGGGGLLTTIRLLNRCQNTW